MAKRQIEINGKQETFEPTTLDQIWGDTGMGKYQTLDVEEYKRELDEMTFTDLQNHCRKHHVFPTDNREFLIKKLIAEFKYHVSQYRHPRVEQKEHKISGEAMKILAEGR